MASQNTTAAPSQRALAAASPISLLTSYLLQKTESIANSKKHRTHEEVYRWEGGEVVPTDPTSYIVYQGIKDYNERVAKGETAKQKKAAEWEEKEMKMEEDDVKIEEEKVKIEDEEEWNESEAGGARRGRSARGGRGSRGGRGGVSKGKGKGQGVGNARGRGGRGRARGRGARGSRGGRGGRAATTAASQSRDGTKADASAAIKDEAVDADHFKAEEDHEEM